MKYSKEYKIKMIKKKKNGELIPYNNNYKSTERWHSQVREWERIYDKLGEEGLAHNKPRLTYEDKLNLVLKVENGESFNSIGESVGREGEQIARWYKKYRQSGIDGLKSLKQGRRKKMKKPSKDKSKSELEQLKEENEYLRAENEYLKKLRALIQEEEKDQPQNKK